MKLDKNTQIILAVGVIAVGLYGVNQLAKGANDAESKIGTGAEIFAGLAGVGVIIRLVAPFVVAAL